MPRHPLTAVPATRSSLPMLQIRRRLVVGFLGMSVVTGILSGIAWATADHTVPTPPASPDQAAIALARTAVEDFLAARKSVVPAAKDVSADFTDTTALSGTPPKALTAGALTYAGSQDFTLGNNGTTTRTVQETFSATIGGTLYDLTVPMVAAGTSECSKPAGIQLPARCWLLGAAPSVTPAPLADSQSQSGLDYTQLYNGAGNDSKLPSDSYRTQIKTWAQTFAAAGHADPRLLALTGDDSQSSQHTYSGLGGWSLAGDPQIKSVVPVSTPYEGLIVRVGLALRSPAANGPTLSTDYDLYIRTDKNQTLPPVVAWGAAGSYRTLVPYFNADQR